MAVANVADHLAKLVSFPTISASSNLDLLAYVEETARPYGAAFRRFPNKEGDKANLLVTIGPEVPGGIVLSGHTDVVPTEGQAWTGDPWTLRERDGWLVGRGASDMKGFLASCLAALPEIAKAPLSRPIHLAFSYDEEVGCKGVHDMAEWVGASELKPRLAIIGESSEMGVVAAHKGGLIGWATVRGKPGHSSQPDRYVNAVMVAADLIAEINRIRAEMRDGPRVEGIEPPYSTIQVNQISGGLHGNIVAEMCRFFWEMRIIPGESDLAVLERIETFAREKLEPRMKAVDPETGISIDVQARIPPLRRNDDPAIEAEMLALTGANDVRFVPYGTEAGIFQNAGVPAIIVGPGNTSQAHQPDEAIPRAQLDRCVAFIGKVAETCR
jgi:acetylornithine deacetylase